MTEHSLKTIPVFFAAVSSGAKRAEIRFNDRNFQVGDTLRLTEWSEEHGYTGVVIHAIVKHVHEGLGLKDGYVMLSLGALRVCPVGHTSPGDVTKYCQVCNGGLSLCTVCNCAEGQLLAYCPGKPLSHETREEIYTGRKVRDLAFFIAWRRAAQLRKENHD